MILTEIFAAELLEIKTFPSEVLRKTASAVDHFNDELHTLCKNMLFTMYESSGIGLAAPQVGVSQRIFVMDVSYRRTEENGGSYENFNPCILINPTIIKREEHIVSREACLSILDVCEEIERDQKISVHYQNLGGEHREIVAEDLKAICIQHEIDHLDGILFFDHLNFFKKNIILKQMNKRKKNQKI